MNDNKKNFISRFSYFLNDCKNAKWKNKYTKFIIWGWLISLVLYISYLHIPNSDIYKLFLIFYIFFFLKLLNEIYIKIRINIELIISICYLFFFIENHLISYCCTTQNTGTFFSVLQSLNILILIFLLCLIFLYNSKWKLLELLPLLVIGILGHYIFKDNRQFFLIIFQLLLFVTLLPKTNWLNDLSKIECLIYWILFFLLLRYINDLNPFISSIADSYTNSIKWHTLPRYLYLIYKYYLLILLIKIPFVLIYNHAKLSNKLRFAGLFQSTFPQLIQLIMLLFMFYFFIAGWQAEKLRNSFQQKFEQLTDEDTNNNINYYRFSSVHNEIVINIDNNTQHFSYKELPSKGIIKHSDYYIFKKNTSVDSNSIYLTKIDTNFIESLTKNVHIIAGSSIDVYALKTNKWESYIYKLDFLYQNDQHIQIFPFTALQSKNKNILSFPLNPFPEYSKNNYDNILDKNISSVIGRVFIPLVENKSTSNRHLAFDLIFNLNLEILWSTIPKLLLFFIIIYSLINVLVIRRVVKFGSQINESIVQKFKQLKNGILQISSGNLEYKVYIEGEDEFVELATRFNEMGKKLQESIEETKEKDRLQYELQMARDVQLSLLPLKIPEAAGYNIAASLETANEVGGDFYDIIPINDQQFLFTIGDVSGKGSSAALYMAQCMSLIRYTKQFTTKPEEICLRLNDYFMTSVSDRQIFVTLIIGLLDIKNNTVKYVRAGHTEPIFIHQSDTNEVNYIRSQGMGIGLTNNYKIFTDTLEIVQLSFNKNDVLIFYTDGVIEASRFSNNEKNKETKMEMFGEKRLEQFSKEVKNLNAHQIEKELNKTLKSFYAGYTRIDDHTLLIISKN